ncbi:hypothetical protein AGMMS49957_02080 [Synergistales bacterium]|nr:hypothetical protein AGMMS49957_02080 [Synergistales bacterium]
MTRDNKIYVRYGNDGKAGAIELLRAGGVEREVKAGMSVALKPNLVVAKPSSSGATTSSLVLSGVIEFFKECGVTDITVMEGSWVGDSTKRAWKICGYDEIAKRYGVKLLDLKDDATTKTVVEGFTFDLCNAPKRADYLVNMPVLKGHCQTVMTCALKNLKGCLSDSSKRLFHTSGLHRPIALLNMALKPHLILADALRGDLSFEEGGNPVEMNRLILGRDPVMLDSYGTSLMGLSPCEVEHLVLAEKLGVGSSKIEDGDIIAIGHDESLFKIGSLPREARRLSAYIDEKSACSACYASLIHALFRTDERNLSGLLGAGKIKIGQGWRGVTAEGLGVGDCASGCARVVPGCPPNALDISRELSHAARP